MTTERLEAVEKKIESLENEFGTAMSKLTQAIEVLTSTQQNYPILEKTLNELSAQFKAHIKTEDKLEKAIERISETLDAMQKDSHKIILDNSQNLGAAIAPIYDRIRSVEDKLADHKIKDETEKTELSGVVKTDLRREASSHLTLIYIIFLGVCGAGYFLYNDVHTDLHSLADKVNLK